MRQIFVHLFNCKTYFCVSVLFSNLLIFYGRPYNFLLQPLNLSVYRPLLHGRRAVRSSPSRDLLLAEKIADILAWIDVVVRTPLHYIFLDKVVIRDSNGFFLLKSICFENMFPDNVILFH